VLSGFPIEKLTSLTILTEPKNFKAALEHLLKRPGAEPSDALFGLAGALKAVATHHVKAPQGQLAGRNRLKPEERRLGSDKQRLEPFQDERFSALLQHQVLLSEAEDHRTRSAVPSWRAVAMAIEIESHRSGSKNLLILISGGHSTATQENLDHPNLPTGNQESIRTDMRVVAPERGAR
jgi:hypothetical protein